jgi:hypothetical protein
LYDDGHQYCFACETYTSEDGGFEIQYHKEKKPMNKDLNFYDTASTSAIADRRINTFTLTMTLMVS